MEKKQQDQTDFMNAAGAVYAWMCVSDGKITVKESEGFARYLNDLPYLDEITHEDFVQAFSEILHAFETDFEDGYSRTLVRIEPLKKDKKLAHDLVKVARLALVVDEDLDEVEENVLRELCSILEVDEASI